MSVHSEYLLYEIRGSKINKPSLLSKQKKYHKFYKFLQQFTEDIDEAEELAEEVSVCPEVVVLEVGVEVVQQQLLLLSLLRFSKQTLG